MCGRWSKRDTLCEMQRLRNLARVRFLFFFFSSNVLVPGARRKPGKEVKRGNQK